MRKRAFTIAMIALFSILPAGLISGAIWGIWSMKAVIFMGAWIAGAYAINGWSIWLDTR